MNSLQMNEKRIENDDAPKEKDIIVGEQHYSEMNDIGAIKTLEVLCAGR